MYERTVKTIFPLFVNFGVPVLARLELLFAHLCHAMCQFLNVFYLSNFIHWYQGFFTMSVNFARYIIACFKRSFSALQLQYMGPAL